MIQRLVLAQAQPSKARHSNKNKHCPVISVFKICMDVLIYMDVLRECHCPGTFPMDSNNLNCYLYCKDFEQPHTMKIKVRSKAAKAQNNKHNN